MDGTTTETPSPVCSHERREPTPEGELCADCGRVLTWPPGWRPSIAAAEEEDGERFDFMS